MQFATVIITFPNSQIVIEIILLSYKIGRLIYYNIIIGTHCYYILLFSTSVDNHRR